MKKLDNSSIIIIGNMDKACAGLDYFLYNNGFVEVSNCIFTKKQK